MNDSGLVRQTAVDPPLHVTVRQTRSQAGAIHDPRRATAGQQEYCDIPAHASFALSGSITFYTGLNCGRSAESARSLLTELFRKHSPSLI